MNAKQHIVVIAVLVMSLVMSGCGAGQLFGPTMTPVPTITNTATLTPTSTPTFTPTNTATPTKTITPTTTPRPLPYSVADAKKHLDIKIPRKPEAAIAIYGQPSSDKLLENYNPRVMRDISYSDLGLEFLFNSNNLYGIHITRPFMGEVFGLRLGDPISRAIAIYGDDFEISDTWVGGEKARAYVWKNDLPKWVFSIPNNIQKRIIVEISFFDESAYGNWTIKTP